MDAMLKMLRNFLVHTWFRLKRPMTLGVRILAANPDGHICLVRHTYTPGWHLPGGGVEKGETCQDAAIKEAREEAGLVISAADIALISIHANFENFPGDHVLVYVASAWSVEATNSAHEIAEYGFFEPTALPSGTTAGTRRRIGEWQGKGVSELW
jgi:8-oxo-dGTP pyrophosphatase MutT (NUDIX family)